MVGDTLRDLQAAQAAGCEPHLVLSGRASSVEGDLLEEMLARVPEARVHGSLGAFADFLLTRDNIEDSGSGGLA
jgi:D-glycero-D-manno-heptose 1,7-bisphosphate phosphatase